MRGFEIVRPTTIERAIELLESGDPGVRPFSGGTAIMQMMKTGMFVPERLVSLAGLSNEHSAISVDGEGGMKIGAMATLSTLERNDLVQTWFPVLARTMKRLANVRVRNVATVGGALSHGDPHMDLPPVLAALDAIAILRGPSGSREVPVADLYTGYYETVLEPGELVAEVVIPPSDGASAIYRKTTSRTADDWPMVGVAASLRLSGSRISSARVIVSAATAKLQRITAAEDVLTGQGPSREVFADAARVASAHSDVIDDAHGSSVYKSALVEIEVRRGLRDAFEGETAE